MNKLLAILAALLLGATAPQAQAGDLAGRWHVSYADLALGHVDGWARFDESNGTVSVLYADPRTGEIVPADGKFTRAGNRVQIVLHGRSPRSDAILPMPGQVVATPVPGDVTLSLGDAELKVSVARPKPPPAEETRLDLELANDRLSLSGAWTQTVDPVTARDGKGQGRFGSFRLLYDGSGDGEMQGLEAWSRPQLAFVTAFALQDQMAFDFGEANWPEPFDANGKLKRPLADRRVIFVIGRDLPGMAAGSVEIESDDPTVSYGVHALASDLRKPSLATAPWVEQAWRMLAQRLPPDRLTELRRYDIMLLDVTLKRGAQPGPKTFRIEGQEAAWQLQFGDWRGQLSIGRQLGFDQTADADYLYPQEQVQFEILLDRDIPNDTLTAIPGVIGAGGETTLGTSAGRAVVLKRDANEPRRYLSDPVVVSDPVYADTYPAGTPLLVAVPGDRIVVQLGDDPILSLRPPLDSAQVIQSPRLLAAALSGDRARRGRLWPDALRAAAACHGIETPDLTGFDALKLEAYEKRIVFAWRKMRQDIALGEHAGAILLRDVFVDLLQGQAREFDRPLTDQEILGFRRLVQNAVWDQLKPLGDVRVTLPGGGSESFAASFVADLMKQRHGLQGEALLLWQIDAARQARKLYAEAIRRSSEIARGIDDCATEKLLGLTGVDFAPVRLTAKQLLVQLSEQPVAGSALMRPAWSADRRARAWIDRVAYVAASIEDIRDLNKDDNDKLLIAVTLATLPLAVIEAPLTLTAMFVMDIGDALVTAGRTLADQLELRAEVKFASGAAAVIGSNRYDAAEARSYEWVQGYFQTLGAAGGAAWSGYELYEGVLTAAQKAAIKDGRRIAEHVTFETLGRLNREDLQSLLQAMKQASAIAARAGKAALDPIERRLIALKDAIQRYREGAPNWATWLERDVWERVKPLAHAPHVGRLFEEARERMIELVRTPEGLDLLWNPHANFADYELAVRRTQSKTKPLGPSFFGQMRRKPPGGLNINDVPGPEKWGSAPHVRIRVNAGTDNAEIADFSRALEPDTEFGTNSPILVLNYAKLEQNLAEDLRMVRGLGQSLTPKGTPLGLYLNLRALHGLGIDYADRQIKLVKLSFVVNVNTCVQMRAMRAAFPEATLEELASHTFSYRYTQDFLEQAGYHVTGVVKVEENAFRGTAARYQRSGFFASSLKPPPNTTAAELAALRAQEVVDFARLHGVDANATIPFGYDIYLRVEPR